MNDWASPWASTFTPPLGAHDGTLPEDSWRDHSVVTDFGNDSQQDTSQDQNGWAVETSSLGVNIDVKDGKDIVSRTDAETHQVAYFESSSDVEDLSRQKTDDSLGPSIDDSGLWNGGAIDQGGVGNVWRQFEQSLGNNVLNTTEHVLPEFDDFATLHIPNGKAITPANAKNSADFLDWHQSTPSSSFTQDAAQNGIASGVKHHTGTVGTPVNTVSFGLDLLNSETSQNLHDQKRRDGSDEELRDIFWRLRGGSAESISNHFVQESFTNPEHSIIDDIFNTRPGGLLGIEGTSSAQLQVSSAPFSSVDQCLWYHDSTRPGLEDEDTLLGESLRERVSNALAEVLSPSNSLSLTGPLSEEIREDPLLSERSGETARISEPDYYTTDIIQKDIVSNTDMSHDGADDDFEDFENFAFAIEGVPAIERDNALPTGPPVAMPLLILPARVSATEPLYAKEVPMVQQQRNVSSEAEAFINQYLTADDELDLKVVYRDILQPSAVQAKDKNDVRSLSEITPAFTKEPSLDVETAASKTVFNIQKPALEALHPSSTNQSDPPEEPPRELLSTTSSRKMWHRISRLGTLRAYDSGDVNDYVRVTWPQSATRKKVLETVSRWVTEDRMNHGVVLFGTNSNPYGPSFSWTDKPAAEANTTPRIQPIEPPRSRQTRRSSVAATAAGSDDSKRFSWSSMPAEDEPPVVARSQERLSPVPPGATAPEPLLNSSATSAPPSWTEALTPQTPFLLTVAKPSQLPSQVDDAPKNNSSQIKDSWGDFQAFESASVLSHLPAPTTILSPSSSAIILPSGPSTAISSSKVVPLLRSNGPMPSEMAQFHMPRRVANKRDQSPRRHNDKIDLAKSLVTGEIQDDDADWADFESFESQQQVSTFATSTTLVTPTSREIDSTMKPLPPTPRSETHTAVELPHSFQLGIPQGLVAPAPKSKSHGSEDDWAGFESFETTQSVPLNTTSTATAVRFPPDANDLGKHFPPTPRLGTPVPLTVPDTSIADGIDLLGEQILLAGSTVLPEQEETQDDWGEFEAFDSGEQIHETVDPVPLISHDDSWLADLPVDHWTLVSQPGLHIPTTAPENIATRSSISPLEIMPEQSSYDALGDLSAFDSAAPMASAAKLNFSALSVRSDGAISEASSQRPAHDGPAKTLQTELSTAERALVEKLVEGLPDFTYMLR